MSLHGKVALVTGAAQGIGRAIAQVQAIADVTQAELDKIQKINVGGTLWGIQAAAKKFIENKQKGKIINASSIAGHNGFALLGVYSATKLAVRAPT